MDLLAPCEKVRLFLGCQRSVDWDSAAIFVARSSDVIGGTQLHVLAVVLGGGRWSYRRVIPSTIDGDLLERRAEWAELGRRVRVGLDLTSRFVLLGASLFFLFSWRC